jgi:hypothetical protein
MLPFAVLDILAEDWIRSRQESARPYGTKPSRIPGYLAAIRNVFRRRTRDEAATPVAIPAARQDRAA